MNIRRVSPCSLLNISRGLYSISDAAALNLTTITGDISMGQAQGSAATLLGLSVSNASASASGSGVFPGTLLAAAPGGSIVFGAGIGAGGRVTLAPSPVGQLDLLAGQAISGGNLMMSDAVPGSYATSATPIGTQKVSDVTEAFNGSIHLNDALPALISAGADITDLTLSIPKAADVVAGNDIVDLRYDGQNLNPTDLTALSAGRDFVFTSTQSSVSVGGPGGLDILAGRNVSLGFSITGVITTGNLSNANLATSQGADLTIAAGLGTAPIIRASSTRSLRRRRHTRRRSSTTSIRSTAAMPDRLPPPGRNSPRSRPRCSCR